MTKGSEYAMTVVETLFDPYYRVELIERLGRRLSLYGIELSVTRPEDVLGPGEDCARKALALVADAVCRGLPADEATVAVFAEEDGGSYLVASAGPGDQASGSSLGLDGATDMLLQRLTSQPGASAMEMDLPSPTSASGVATMATTAIVAPVYVVGNVTGMIAAMQHSGSSPAAGARLELLSVILGSVLTELSNEIVNEDRLRSLAKGLSAALDARDSRTRGHSDRVAMYAMAIFNEMAPGEDILGYQRLRSSIRLGALLHDVGKIGIPDCILLKPDSLTSDEYEVIKRHSLMGAEILNACHGFESLVPGVLYHHERCNGKGYPFGLDRKKIPAIAKVIGLADAFDAITSDRPFRKASTHDEAIEILSKTIPDCYEQEVYDALVRAHKEGALKDVGIPMRSSRMQAPPESKIDEIYGSQVKSVPSLPSVLATVSSLVDDPNASLRDIAKILSTDEGLASRALKLVNSAYYGLPQTIATIPLAATILGARAIKSYLVNIAISDLMYALGSGHEEYGLLWAHALRTALWAKGIAKKTGVADSEEAFTAGLVHDIGKALSLRFRPDDYSKLVVEADKSGRALMAAEAQLMGFDHTELGAWAARKWMLPDMLVSAIRWHHNPDDLADECSEIANMVRVIHVADIQARCRKDDAGLLATGHDSISPGSTEQFGKELLEQLEGMREEMEEQEHSLRDSYSQMKISR
jgi:putative nucleotidyltransferase with HDIG domain